MGKKLFESGYVKVSKPVEICRPTFANLRSVAIWCGGTKFTVDFSDSMAQKVTIEPENRYSNSTYFQLGDILAKSSDGTITVISQEELDEQYEKRKLDADKNGK